ncbi:MAG: hypothetical protein O9972_22825 [Burkholderiales bacterium]|nr:hypothetical protein [Burkholderiales bacterium]
MPRYIERRRQTYYAVVEVPPSLRLTLGKKRLLKSLETRDLAIARDRRWAVVAALKKQIEEARGGADVTTLSPIPRHKPDNARLIEEALRWRETIAAEGPYSEPDEVKAVDLLEDRAEQIKDDRDRDAFIGVATGTSTPVTTHLETWLTESRFKPRTAGDRRRALERLEAWGVTSIEEVTRRKAGEYVSHLMTHRDKTWSGDHATVVKYISALSSYWTFMRRKGHVESNPWVDQTPPKPKPSSLDHDHDTDERPFTDDEVKKLLAGTTLPLLQDVMRIGALSGARLDAIVSLKVKDCLIEGSGGPLFRFKPQKGEKKARLVPVHPDLMEIVKRRTKGRDLEAFLFDEVETPSAGSERERSMPVSKRFGRYLRSLDLEVMVPGKRRSLTNFHSWRRWFSTKAEQAGQAENVIASVLGHKRGSITLDLYSRGPGEALMRTCVEAVRLP